ncbi:MAG: branched-chain amino acid ABC transporter permease [Rhodospirillaceae bacterium]|nr:branched-chain amino acid ABC transporter permease [Rhodospirillaceae bacterium]
MIDFINQYMIPALVLGSIYALGAIGVSMIFAILRFAHFAHGDLMAVGAYIGLLVVWMLEATPIGEWPINRQLIIALPLAFAGTAVCAILIDRLFYKPFRRAKSMIVVVIASFGVALMLRSLIQLFFGVDVINYADGIQFPVTYFQPVRILERHIYIVFGAIMLMLALHYMLTRTRTGKAMRAMSDDADLARVSGINTERVVMWTWILGAGLVAIAGVFLGMDTRLVPTMGWDMLLSVFAAAILGGLGQPYGAIAGGLIIGTLEEFSTYPWFGDTPFISPDYKTAVAFGIMILVLIFRPQGIFRGKVL